MNNECRISWLITEYQELKKEIERRSKEQFLCISGSIIALGSVVGFIAKSPEDYSPLLIIVPWILAIFGIIWVDHSHHIFLIGSYIREGIESQINLINCDNNIGWQHYTQSFLKKDKLPSFIVYLLPILYFIFPSIICIFAYFLMRFYKMTKLPVLTEISLILIGTIFLVVLFIGWLRAVRALKK